MIVDLFAGPGGWDQGLRALDLDEPVAGVEWDADACKTAKAAGHARVRADVSQLDPRMFPRGSKLVGSPPCTKFSGAGSGIGRGFLGPLGDAIRRTLDGEDCREEMRALVYPAALKDRIRANAKRVETSRWTQERLEAAARADAFCTVLVLEPARWIHDMGPEWVALEQVPDVLPIWQALAFVLRLKGWSAWTGVLNSANYGVAQTRERAILIASRVRRVEPPEPTHAEIERGADLFGGSGLRRWVSMAEQIGWGFDGEPSATITSGGAATGGAEPFGNAGYRRRLARYMGDVRSSNGTIRSIDSPSATLPAAMDNGNWRWVPSPRAELATSVRITVEDAALLQSFPADYPWAGTKSKQFEQVGNAVPPQLAAHVVAAASGARALLDATEG